MWSDNETTQDLLGNQVGYYCLFPDFLVTLPA